VGKHVVHTARRTYRLNGPVKLSDRGWSPLHGGAVREKLFKPYHLEEGEVVTRLTECRYHLQKPLQPDKKGDNHDLEKITSCLKCKWRCPRDEQREQSRNLFKVFGEGLKPLDTAAARERNKNRQCSRQGNAPSDGNSASG
jgi:hypothetical protein